MQVFVLAVTWLSIGAGLAVAASAPGNNEVTLDALRDHYRPLLVFAPSAKEALLLDQLRILDAAAAAAADRDLIVIALPFEGDAPTKRSLSETDAQAARKRFHVGQGEFVVILVGKDGGEKLRETKPVPFEKLRDVIDAMPMRQQEMKRRGL